jgi:hypothetical protein
MPVKKYETVPEEVKELGPRREGTWTWEKKGQRRHRIKPSSMFGSVLTERQRTVLKGKVRLSRQYSRVVELMRKNDMTMEEFVEQLSPEELVRGQVKDRGGYFRGAPPQWVPRAFHRACIAELMKRGRYLWQDSYLKAIETMSDIAAGKGNIGKIATPGERIKAAQFVIERLEGKIPERLMIAEDKKWEAVLEGIVADVSDEAVERGQRALAGAQEALEIIEADVVEEVEYEQPVAAPRRARARATRRTRR